MVHELGDRTLPRAVPCRDGVLEVDARALGGHHVQEALQHHVFLLLVGRDRGEDQHRLANVCGVSAHVLAMAGQGLVRGPEAVDIERRGVPLIGVLGNDAQRAARPAPPDEDRRPTGRRVRLRIGAADAVVLAFECARVGVPEFLHERDRLFEAVVALGAGREVNAVDLVLVGVPAGAETHDKASRRERLELLSHPAHVDRLPERDWRHQRAEANALGLRGRHDKRQVDVDGVLLLAVEVMIRPEQRVEAQTLDKAADMAPPLPPQRRGLTDDDPDVHRCLPLASRSVVSARLPTRSRRMTWLTTPTRLPHAR